MSSTTPHRRTRSERGPAVEPISLATVIGFPLLLAALLVVASRPLASLAALTALASATKLAQFALAALVRRTGTSPRRVTVPGVGTVTVRVTPV